jgi:hypothetical protein
LAFKPLIHHGELTFIDERDAVLLVVVTEGFEPYSIALMKGLSYLGRHGIFTASLAGLVPTYGAIKDLQA